MATSNVRRSAAPLSRLTPMPPAWAKALLKASMVMCTVESRGVSAGR